MNEIYKLDNQIKHYEWGSPQFLPQFLNIENAVGLPFAEMWMGTHSGAPSKVVTGNKNEPEFLKDISGELPFLLKMIAVDKPLSIQAHPDKKQAEEGFKKEELSGLDINAPTRNYKDFNHKPEIVCAVTPFSLMAGFREPENICLLFEEFISVGFNFSDRSSKTKTLIIKEIISPLIHTIKSGTLADFFRLLFDISKDNQEQLCLFINNYNEAGADGLITNEQWKLMKKFALLYPADPAILSPLYLNCLTLQSGQAIYVPAGILHAYTSGFAAELMTSSDNVLRGGLTPKHIDINELMNILSFTPYLPKVITPPAGTDWFCYQTPCDEFLLAHMSANDKTIFKGNYPAICIVTEGELKIKGNSFKKGESFFIQDNDGSLVFDGDFSLFAACSCSIVSGEHGEAASEHGEAASSGV